MLQRKFDEPISEPTSPRQFPDHEDKEGGLIAEMSSLKEQIRIMKQQMAKRKDDILEQQMAKPKDDCKYVKVNAAPYNITKLAQLRSSYKKWHPIRILNFVATALKGAKPLCRGAVSMSVTCLPITNIAQKSNQHARVDHVL